MKAHQLATKTHSSTAEGVLYEDPDGSVICVGCGRRWADRADVDEAERCWTMPVRRAG